MSIGLDDYFTLLDETRGLYPWRELFTARRVKPVLREKFFGDMKALFPDGELTFKTAIS